MNDTDSISATHEQAVSHKESAVGVATKIWRHVVESDATAAANFLNLTPAQGAGEASVTNRSDGRVDVYYFL
jgi:hypothetical protein